MAVIVIGHERVRDNPDRVKRRQPLEQSNKHFLLGVAEWPVSPCSHSPVVAVVPREALAEPLQASVSGFSVQVSGRCNIVWFILIPET
jgi:hypothetical protein